MPNRKLPAWTNLKTLMLALDMVKERGATDDSPVYVQGGTGKPYHNLVDVELDEKLDDEPDKTKWPVVIHADLDEEDQS